MSRTLVKCVHLPKQSYRSLWNTVPTQQGGCVLQLPTLGIGWLCHCVRLLDDVVRSHEAVRAVRRAGGRRDRLHHRGDPTPTKGECRGGLGAHCGYFEPKNIYSINHLLCVFHPYRNVASRSKKPARRPNARRRRRVTKSRRPTTSVTT